MTQADPRFASVARAFEVIRELSGYLDQALEVITVSDFPHERGLDLSATATGTIIRVVLDVYGREAAANGPFALTQMAEQIARGKSPGLDAAAACSLRPIRFQEGQMRPLSQRIENASSIIADSRIHGSTRKAVGDLHRRHEGDPDNTGPCINRLGALTQNTIMALDQADTPALGAAMDGAHTMLTELGLSLSILDNLAEAACSTGTLGAKLTGGGPGDHVTALAIGGSATRWVHAVLEQAGAPKTWSYRMHINGVDE